MELSTTAQSVSLSSPSEEWPEDEITAPFKKSQSIVLIKTLARQALFPLCEFSHMVNYGSKPYPKPKGSRCTLIVHHEGAYRIDADFYVLAKIMRDILVFALNKPEERQFIEIDFSDCPEGVITKTKIDSPDGQVAGCTLGVNLSAEEQDSVRPCDKSESVLSPHDRLVFINALTNAIVSAQKEIKKPLKAIDYNQVVSSIRALFTPGIDPNN